MVIKVFQPSLGPSELILLLRGENVTNQFKMYQQSLSLSNPQYFYTKGNILYTLFLTFLFSPKYILDIVSYQYTKTSSFFFKLHGILVCAYTMSFFFNQLPLQSCFQSFAITSKAAINNLVQWMSKRTGFQSKLYYYAAMWPLASQLEFRPFRNGKNLNARLVQHLPKHVHGTLVPKDAHPGN